MPIHKIGDKLGGFLKSEGEGHYGPWLAANKMTKEAYSAFSGSIKLKIGQRC